jgi:hypothetical protein
MKSRLTVFEIEATKREVDDRRVFLLDKGILHEPLEVKNDEWREFLTLIPP